MSAKTSIAAGFEHLAAVAVADRGPVPVKAKGGTMRMLRTEEGSPVTHGEVLEGAAARAGVELATEGRRPEIIICACKAVVKVGARGKIPARCVACAHEAKKDLRGSEKEKNAAAQRKWVAKNRAVKRARDRAAYARQKAARLPDDGLALPVFEDS